MSNQKMTGRKVLNITPHILMWGFLFVFPMLFSDEGINYRRLAIRNWIPLFFAMVVFYTNFFYFVDRFLVRKKVVLFIIVNICLLIVCVWAINLTRDMLLSDFMGGRFQVRNSVRMIWFRNGLSMLLAIGISVAVRVTGRWYAEESKRKKMENEHLKSELTYLRYQLQPHFFFNTLNNIYALVEKDPSMAQASIHQLSKLMRYLLYESGAEKVSLAKEVNFLKSYISLMTLRVPNHVSVDVRLPEVHDQVQVAPLLFVSLVENAFKHGIHATLPGFIGIELKMDETQLLFRVENSKFPKPANDKSGSGIGLQNLQKRLDILYPDSHTLTSYDDDKKYKTTLVLYLKNDENKMYDRR